MALDRSVAVGGFVFGGLSLGVAAILLFGGLAFFKTNIRVVAYFPGSVAGLTIGAPVTFRGVKVGAVASMRVHVELSELKAVIPVFLDIDPSQITWTQGAPAKGSADLRRAVEAGLRAQLASQSLITGEVGVDLDFHPGPPDRRIAADSMILEIPTVTSDIQHLKDELVQLNLPGLADHATKAFSSVQQAADVLARQVTPLTQSALQTAAEARVTLKSATVAIRAVQDDASRTMADLNLLIMTSRRQVLSTGQNLDRTITRIDALTVTLNDAIAPRSPMRGDLEASLRDLAATASSLRLLTHDLQRNPATTLFGHSGR